MDIDVLIKKQRIFFDSGVTLNVDFRRDMLKELLDAINRYESEISNALTADLGKSDYEGFMCEIGLVRSEISHMVKHLKGYAKDKTVRTSLAQFSARSYVKPCPYGNVLIMSPWNYPFLLAIEPLVDAIAAGNTAIVKPSAYAPATASVIEKILTDCYDPGFVGVVNGGRKENTELLKKKFDFIFFTGSQTVGKEVLRNAAENLTPVVLELGGKSPCIVDSSAKIPLAAKRIVFGKFINCGQTCVAPDYVLCHESIKDQLIEQLCLQIRRQYGSDPLKNPDYGHIVNQKHFHRLCGLIEQDKVVIGGHRKEDTLQIAPTVLADVTWEDPVMQEEIFGPVLPVMTYSDIDQIYAMFADKPKPLALYIFAEDKRIIRNVTARCRYGGGCINDCIVHLTSPDLGFGGVGESGMGSYHGKAGFDVFSHSKSIMDKKTWIDLPMRYQPYKRQKYGKLVRFFLK